MSDDHIGYYPSIVHRRYVWGRERLVHNHNSHIRFFYTSQEKNPNSDSLVMQETPMIYRGNRLYPIGAVSSSNENSTRPTPRSNNRPQYDEKPAQQSKPNGERNQRPRILTIIRNGKKPYSFFKILLNRNSIQTFPDLLSDISEAFGPSWKGKPITKLFTPNGKEAKEPSDLFKSDSYFVAIGDKEAIPNPKEIKKMVTDTFPDYDKSKEQDSDDNNPSKKDSTKDKKRAYDSDPSWKTPVWKESTLSEETINSGPHNQSSKNNNNNNNSTLPKVPSYPNDNQNKSPPMKVKNNNPRKGSLTKPVNQMEDLPPGYPYNDSRKPGPFDMPNEIPPTDVQLAKLKAQLLNLERMRISMEERERARAIRARRLEQEEADRLRRQNNRDENPYDKRQNPMNHSNNKYNTPNMSSGGKPRHGGKYDKENWPPSKNKGNDWSLRKNNGEYNGGPNRYNSKNPQNRRPQLMMDRDQLPISRFHYIRMKNPNSKDPNDTRKRRSLDNVKNKPRKNWNNKYHPSSDDDMANSQYKKKDRDGTNRNMPRDNNGNNNKRPGEGRKENSNSKDPQREVGGRGQKQFKDTRKNPANQRIVPSLAKQLAYNEDFGEHYNIGPIIGTGKFADVKLAKKRESGKPYAAKIIDKKKLKDKVDLIEEEIRIQRMCDHPNIVKLIDQFESPDKVYLIEELIKEGDLFDAICEHIKFPEYQSAIMMRDLLSALMYIHNRGIVHRDIKPENLLCTTTDDVINLKLADFGLAINATEPLYAICGTPTYVAPEILKEKGYGIEIDIWAAGVICYILLCGFPPFKTPDRDQTEVFEFIKAGEFEYMKPYWDDSSEQSKDLINHMLVVDPKKRYTVEDCLCHPWLVTLGNTVKTSKPIKEAVIQVRNDLKKEAAQFRYNN